MTVSARSRTAGGVRSPAAKVPEITAVFWVVKILTTGVGEAASDYLASVDRVVAAAVGLALFGAALTVQWRAPRYLPSVYWLAVSAVAVFGTMAADVVHVVLGVPYPVTSTAYALIVGVTFFLWYRSQGTLDVHTVTRGPREAFYWTTVLATFALGTALGDLSAFTLGLGYWSSAVLYAVLIAVPALAWWRFHLHPVIAFWSAYVLTRPLGASLADWLGKPAARSGLGWGDGAVTVVGAAAIAMLVLASRPRPTAGTTA